MTETKIFPGRFDGRCLTITGAAQGIGLTVATRIAAEGGEVVLVDRADLVHEVAEQLREAGGKAHSVTADLETFEGAEEAISHAVRTTGRIDVLINVVGGTIWPSRTSTMRRRRSRRRSGGRCSPPCGRAAPPLPI